jgi:uncharacterized coiled-coil protein SlyX
VQFASPVVETNSRLVNELNDILAKQAKEIEELSRLLDETEKAKAE